MPRKAFYKIPPLGVRGLLKRNYASGSKIEVAE